MANKIDGDRWVFSATTTAEEEETLSGFYQLLGIFWTSDESTGNDIAADDDFLLTDGDGLRIAGKRAESAGDDFGVVISYPGLPVKGIKVKKSDGGILTIWRKLPYT